MCILPIPGLGPPSLTPPGETQMTEKLERLCAKTQINFLIRAYLEEPP